ncbi:hypothetical protein, conserved, DUF530 family [Thermococcus kodakarensis KOD1]|uniref:DUF530 domain-containing protein n=1 Tax=Thermococcus kodakarensis (strain ATCC BAA-918 / JCM 12380 / KOD1) TaxID=69014 RepID=Q5JH83_THEKO|nr:DUF530 family protein [Thermococcus kodakarensis]WCN28810.1 DUF530 family protein [Thermococcus kodakarensis]WCN31110.1 DUF530 family protein [Thermococcus kodakarensis]BAD84986.1 hypothetical protein, conserved, DUF530 family [Thermococcus kodakarensis KOD1]
MTTTEELVAQVNKILDDIGIDLGELFQDFDPVRLALTLNRNLSLLEELEEELERRVGEGGPSVPMGDRKNRDPHLQWLYRKRHYRTLALERLRSAITAHKIALAILDANYTFKRGSSEIKATEIKDEKVKATRKPYSIGRVEILPYLAYSGDVLKLLARESLSVRDAFKEIKGRLREQGMVKTRSIRLEVEYFENNRLKKAHVSLPADADIEAELRKQFGRRFRWRVLSLVKTRGVLINNHYTVDNLALAYASFNPEKGAELLGLDIFRYYFLTSPADRETLGVFPGIKSCLDCHYSILDLPFRWDPNFKTGQGSLYIIRKCEMEEQLVGRKKDLSGVPNYLLGGVLLYGISNYDEKKVAEILGIPEDELTEAMKKFVISGLANVLFTKEEAKKFDKFMPKSDKAKQFLALLQG